jgi:glycosyltransferase involved in cell wall biosynthesis
MIDRNTFPPGRETKPKISVIVPIHKTEAYLEKCLRSVMEQTLREIEIICVDDASPDNSAAIVERLMREDGRIRLIRHDRNLGLGGARNTGIAAARAPYVTGVDSDDYILPEMMERLWEEGGEGAADVVVCGMALVRGDGSLILNVSRPRQTYRNDMNQVDIINALTPSFCNKLWRTILFTAHGITFPEHQYFEDLATTPRLLRFAKSICVIPDPLYCYVQREGSIMNTTSPRHIIDHFRTFDMLTDFLTAEGLIDRYRAELVEMIGKSLAYHTKFVMKSSMEQVEKARYMKYMLILKLAYLEHNDTVRPMEPQALQSLLLGATSGADLQSVPGSGGVPSTAVT